MYFYMKYHMYYVIGHTNKFYEINKFLLKEASRLNYYNIKNYKLKPYNYCGLIINELLI